MHTLCLHHRHLRCRQTSVQAGSPARNAAATTTTIPRLRHRTRTALPTSWHGRQRASYYFDASHQGAMSLRVLLAECQSGADRLGTRSPPQLLTESLTTLLRSICPGIEDDSENRDYYLRLLRMHMSQLTGSELQSLAAILKAQAFECVVIESVVDDESLREYGFANGPPYSRMRSLLQTAELFNLLDDLQQDAAHTALGQPYFGPLEASLALAARAWLASCCLRWQESSWSLSNLLDAAHEIAAILDVSIVFQDAIAAAPSSRAAMLEAKNSHLLIEPPVAALLEGEQGGLLIARVLRDLLEIILTQKLFGTHATPRHLTQSQRRLLLESLDKILVYCDPPAVTEAMQIQAEAVLKDRKDFGQVHIMPTLGAALGHAWIAPQLSLVPDKSRLALQNGVSFVHSGFQLAVREVPTHEWPIRFLSAHENENLYPANRAWQLMVPAQKDSLQAAAKSVIREWQERALAYRFISSQPGVEATGCRVTVWQAVQRGMSADALALFQHYNRGLPEPDSPTEVWLRLDGMMRWIKKISRSDRETL